MPNTHITQLIHLNQFQEHPVYTYSFLTLLLTGHSRVKNPMWKTKNNMDIAIKMFEEYVNITEIEKEVKSLLLVNHENIVKFYGITKDSESRTLILMEYADGGSLYDFLHGSGKDRKYSYNAALNWMLQCAKGMAYMHGMNPKILHRDLKTQNLLLANNLRTLKICDFGKVRELATKMTTYPAGTAGYMAPEVARGEPYTEMCDVYSFGIILWEVMSRKKPFSHLETFIEMAIQYQVDLGNRPPLEDVIFENSDHIKILIQICWNKKISVRPTMKELVFTLSIDPHSSDPKCILKFKPLLEISDKDITDVYCDNNAFKMIFNPFS